MDPDTCESLFENQNNLNNGQMFFIMLSFIPLAILMPIWIVASFIYTPWIKAQERLALLEDEVEEIPYVEKYNLKKATNDNLKTLDCDKSFVMETTPEGAVLMKYNKKDEGFDYWADKNIKFKHLEVVARKYVTDYLCKDFYVDRKKYMKEKLNKIKEEIETNKKILEEEKNKSEEEKKKERKAETDNTKDDDVFANLKSNKNNKEKKNLKIKLTRADFVSEIGTKFMKKGKLADSMLQKKTESSEDIKQMSFSDWKMVTKTSINSK